MADGNVLTPGAEGLARVLVFLAPYTAQAVIAALGAVVGVYVAARFKNLAQKQDIEAITEKVEAVKADMQKGVFVHRIYHEHRVTAMAEVWREYRHVIFALAEFTVDLEARNEEPERDIDASRNEYLAAYREFYESSITGRPFFPESVLGAIDLVHKRHGHVYFSIKSYFKGELEDGQPIDIDAILADASALVEGDRGLADIIRAELSGYTTEADGRPV